MYPVEVAYLQEPTPDYVRKSAETVWNIHMQVSMVSYSSVHAFYPPVQQTPGDILVFLTGREEIERCLEELSEYLPTYVLSLHSQMPCSNIL